MATPVKSRGSLRIEGRTYHPNPTLFDPIQPSARDAALFYVVVQQIQCLNNRGIVFHFNGNRAFHRGCIPWRNPDKVGNGTERESMDRNCCFCSWDSRYRAAVSIADKSFGTIQPCFRGNRAIGWVNHGLRDEYGFSPIEREVLEVEWMRPQRW